MAKKKLNNVTRTTFQVPVPKVKDQSQDRWNKQITSWLKQFIEERTQEVPYISVQDDGSFSVPLTYALQFENAGLTHNPEGTVIVDLTAGPAGANNKVAVDGTATSGFLGANSNDGVLRVSSPFTYTDGGDWINLSMTQATDSTDGYLDFLDWNTFNDKADYLFGANDFSGTGNFTTSGGVTANTLTGTVLTASQPNIDHDSLTNFVADEHVAHTGVTLTAGTGLDGGGDISSNRTFDVNIGEIEALIDHNALLNLAVGDVHAQYLLSAGRGGQTITDDITITGDLTVDTDTLFVDSANDYVGIGTITPSAKLDVGGLTSWVHSGDPIASFTKSDTGVTGISMRNTSATGTNQDFKFVISDTTGHYIALSVPGVSNNGTRFGTANEDSDFIFNTGGTKRHLTIGTLSAKNLQFGTNNTERMRIDSAGFINMYDGLDVATDLTVGASVTISPFTTAGYVKNDTDGLLSGGNLIYHNDLEGLNVGDYQHLTAAEKTDFDTLTDGSNADPLHKHSHTNLEDLDQVDDHLLYLDLAGTRPMTGNLNMDDFNVNNVGHIQFDLNHVAEDPSSGEEEGTLAWNTNELALEISSGRGPVAQVPYEMWLPRRLSWNNTGSDIPDGTVVYLCKSGGVVCIAPVNSRDPQIVEKTVGITTQLIPDGEVGFVTTYGEVRGLDTSSWSVGETLYVSPTVDGGLTSTRPIQGDWPIPLCEVVVSDPDDGVLFVKYLQIFDPDDIKNATGFPEQNAAVKQSDISFTDIDRTLTIAPNTGGGYDTFYIWQLGIKYIFDSAQNIEILDEEGTYYIYFDEGVLTYVKNPDTGTIITLIRTKVLVSIIYWRESEDPSVGDGGAVIIGDERHGYDMSGSTHAYLHRENGMVWDSGLALGDMNVDGSGDDDSAAQFSTTGGITVDEDLINISFGTTSTTGLPIFYLDGANANLRRLTETAFSVTSLDGTTNTRLAFNEFTGGAWQISEVSNNDFALCHIFGTNSPQDPVIAFMGQASYGTIGQARTGANTEISTIVTNYPGPELVEIATIIYQTSNLYDNGVSARVRSTDEGEDYIDWRGSKSPTAGAAPTDHGNLSGLADDDHIQYLLLAGRGGQTITDDIDITGTLAVDDTIITEKLFAVEGAALATITDTGIICGEIGANGSMTSAKAGGLVLGFSAAFSTIETDGIGAISNGSATVGSTIRASAEGAHAQGKASSSGHGIFADGVGSYASGEVDGDYDILASGKGSMAIGYADTGEIRASGNNSFQFGPGLNDTANSLQIGIIENNGVWLGANGDIIATGDVDVDRDLTVLGDTEIGGDTEVDGELTALRLLSSIGGATNIAVGGDTLMDITTGTVNVAIGQDALESNTSGNSNMAIGGSSLQSNLDGTQNTAIGVNSLNLNTDKTGSTAVGFEALKSSNSNFCTAIGHRALYSLTTNSDTSVAIGGEALYYCQTNSSNNVAVGWQAGKGTTGHSKVGCVFIGRKAGRDENSSNKLYIANSETATPLVYGDFSTPQVTVNGALTTTGTLTVGAYTLPATDGTNGQVLQTNGSGILTWVTP
jgi:hypothetical protein